VDALSLTEVSAPDADIAALLQAHFDLMRATSPAESCHVMQPADVFDEVSVMIAARQGDDLLGIGALKVLDAGHAELKSMHTTPASRGQGVGAAILNALLAKARTGGQTRVSLETGSMDAFAPARRLYGAHGFTECPPFGSYCVDPLSTFMTKEI
jgi:putative acetyltransferase